MKLYKRLSIIYAVIVFLNFCILGELQPAAHEELIDVSYDACSYSENDQGINKRWYVLNDIASSRHLSHEVNTIKYYFEEIPDNSSIWSDQVNESLIEEIKTSFVNSMKKWNNVYFYSYDSDGAITKNKVINIVEGTESDHNLSISLSNNGNVASTYIVENSQDPDQPIGNDQITHIHYLNYTMTVNIEYFYVHEGITVRDIMVLKERTGAHEIGHIFGLMDIDVGGICGANSNVLHHEEFLMGYSEETSTSAKDITYKDIAGVAITRGFHARDDHRWLNCGRIDFGDYKLICSICNGFKFVSSLSGYTYNEFGACNNSHTLSSGNMMAVASYGDKDYYKCKYCRYVAPFSAIEQQNYTVTPVAGGTHHQYTNNVDGLSYSFLEEHTWIGGECGKCGYDHPHEYSYKYKNGTYHTKTCSCGVASTEVHFIRSSDIVNGRASCLGCKRMLDLNKDTANVLPTSITQITVNGSYILSNGIVVLVDADIEAYMNGTLIFYDRGSLPTTE